ncbi:MAG: GNAT family protein [Gammaproteobacteria bacterium]|nr:GNAT family protein [Gammaproteobacteria bacterium]
MTFLVEPVLLQGEYVRVEPLSQEHANGLFNRGQTEQDWDYMPRPCFVDLADCRHWIDEANNTAGQVPFAIVETRQGRAVGSSRYMTIRSPHRGLEIGYSWLGRDYQGGVINTEAKLLLLQHALETLSAVRVEFKTDGRNTRSQRALQAIGATLEGTLRNHMIVQNDFVRDSVYFSITVEDWPRVKEHLQARLVRRAAQ